MSERSAPDRSPRQLGLLIPAFLLLGIGSWSLTEAFLELRAAKELRGLEADEQTIRVGTFAQGEVAHLQFNLTNHGTKAVKLLRVDPSCGCTKVSPSANDVLPHESVIIEADWNVESSRGDVSTLLIVGYLEHGSSEMKRLVLTARAIVEPDIIIEPDEIRFIDNEMGRAHIRLSPGRLQQFRVLDAWSETQTIAAEVQSSKRTVVVTYDPARWKPAHSAFRMTKILVKTNSPNEPIMRIPVSFLKSQGLPARM
jgi:hypothetical protein